MLTIIAFILTMLGSINWLMVGLLQYDFVAGIFGYQSSILSRIVYIIVGVASLFLIYKLIKGKGTLAVFSFRNKNDLMKNIKKIGKKEDNTNTDKSEETVPAQSNLNVEAGEENFGREVDNSFDRRDDDPSFRSSKESGLFDEHFGDRDDF